jgi:hypothetical protein
LNNAGEIGISDDTRLNLANRVVGEQKQLAVKGKDQLIKVYLIS